MQYTIIGEPSEGRFYPLYRERDGEEWQYFTILGIQVFYEEKSEAQHFIDGKPIEHGWSNESDSREAERSTR